MKKKLVLFCSLLVFLVVIAASFISVVYVQTRPVNLNNSENVKIEIRSGMTVADAGRLLKSKNIIKNSKLFYYSIRFPFLQKILFPSEKESFTFVLKSGSYNLNQTMNYIEIQKVLSSGQQEYIKVSVPEGLTISKIGQILEEKDVCKASDFILSCHNSKVYGDFGINAESCEGFLFPDTYFLTAGMNSDSVVKIFIENFFEKIKTVPNLSEKNAADLYETVKLASVVEREYRVEDEAPLIASVFKNRLRRNIGLYSCATVEYIITEIQGRPHPERILISDTKIDSPYNTYLHAGLPPTPISNPGLVALGASTNTPKTNYYFFQVIDADAGRHVFASTLEEHKVNHYYTKKSGK